MAGRRGGGGEGLVGYLFGKGLGDGTVDTLDVRFLQFALLALPGGEDYTEGGEAGGCGRVVGVGEGREGVRVSECRRFLIERERERTSQSGRQHAARRGAHKKRDQTLACTCKGRATQVMRGVVGTHGGREAARKMTRNSEEGLTSLAQDQPAQYTKHRRTWRPGARRGHAGGGCCRNRRHDKGLRCGGDQGEDA